LTPFAGVNSFPESFLACCERCDSRLGGGLNERGAIQADPGPVTIVVLLGLITGILLAWRGSTCRA
jgi:hypothetical protein